MPKVEQTVVFTQEPAQQLDELVGALQADRVFLLVDENTRRHCLPRMSEARCLQGVNPIVIGATDVHKNLDTLVHVWTPCSRAVPHAARAWCVWAAAW